MSRSKYRNLATGNIVELPDDFAERFGGMERVVEDQAIASPSPSTAKAPRPKATNKINSSKEGSK